MLVLLILVALMTGAYAAYTTNLNIGATTSQSGTYGVVLTGCTTEVVKIGTAGAQAPTATCSPSGASTEGAATCSANFMQPGDSVRCNFNVKNTGNLKAKADGNILCDSGNSAAGGFNVSSSLAFSDNFFASCAFVIIPFSPIITFKDTPAKISILITVLLLLYDEKF